MQGPYLVGFETSSSAGLGKAQPLQALTQRDQNALLRESTGYRLRLVEVSRSVLDKPLWIQDGPDQEAIVRVQCPLCEPLDRIILRRNSVLCGGNLQRSSPCT